MEERGISMFIQVINEKIAVQWTKKLPTAEELRYTHGSYINRFQHFIYFLTFAEWKCDTETYVHFLYLFWMIFFFFVKILSVYYRMATQWIVCTNEDGFIAIIFSKYTQTLITATICYLLFIRSVFVEF